MSFAILVAIRDQIKTCMDGCDYKIFVSLGDPPADCNSIAVFSDSSRRNRSDNSECTTNVFDSDISVTITRCCVASDAQLEFSPSQEEKDAECFHNDLDALIACLSCSADTVLQDYIISCGTLIDEIRLDREKMGGCYSATIGLSFTEDICCP